MRGKSDAAEAAAVVGVVRPEQAMPPVPSASYAELFAACGEWLDIGLDREFDNAGVGWLETD